MHIIIKTLALRCVLSNPFFNEPDQLGVVTSRKTVRRLRFYFNKFKESIKYLKMTSESNTKCERISDNINKIVSSYFVSIAGTSISSINKHSNCVHKLTKYLDLPMSIRYTRNMIYYLKFTQSISARYTVTMCWGY